MLGTSTKGAIRSRRVKALIFPEREALDQPNQWLIEQGCTLIRKNFHPFRIVDGCICLLLPLADGRRQILDVLGPGRLFSEHFLNLNRCNAIALTMARLRAVDLDIDKHATVDALEQMLRRAQLHAALLGRRTMTEKVAVALLDLAHQFAIPAKSASRSDVTFALHLTRADLADWLGLTLSTVSRCLNAFKHHRLIAFDHPKLITIQDRAALEALASGIAVAAYPSPRSGSGNGFTGVDHPAALTLDRQAN